MDVNKIDAVVTPVSEEIIGDLLRMDADFFADGHYVDFLGAYVRQIYMFFLAPECFGGDFLYLCLRG